jgi:acylphosphatase
MSDPVSRRLRITGRVQGVWFREAMRLEAERLGVRGYVRNRHDGSVEALVQGEAAAVEALTRWARRGPEQAVVAAVEASEAPGEGPFAAFEKRPTA